MNKKINTSLPTFLIPWQAAQPLGTWLLSFVGFTYFVFILQSHVEPTEIVLTTHNHASLFRSNYQSELPQNQHTDL